MGLRAKSSKGEQGSAIVEFVAFLSLFLLPLIAFFTLVTSDSNVRLRNEEMFREVIQIIISGDELTQSVSTARRYLALQNSSASLDVLCVLGTCPRRGSLMKVIIIGGETKMETVVKGGKWS